MKFRLLTMAALTTAALLAQGPGAPPSGAGAAPPAPTELATALNLSDAQVTSLIQLQASKRTQMEPIAQQAATQRKALAAALAKTNPDASAIAAILVQLQTLKTQMDTVNASFVTQATAILTTDQKTKLKDLQAAQGLIPAVHQAEGLNLLARPANAPEPGGPGGPGMGPMGRPGPPL